VAIISNTRMSHKPEGGHVYILMAIKRIH